MHREIISKSDQIRPDQTKIRHWDWWNAKPANTSPIDVPNSATQAASAPGTTNFLTIDPVIGARARPWDLPMLVLGMFGIPGVLLWMGVMLVPVILSWQAVLPKFWRLPPSAGSVAMSGIVVVMFLDSLQNSPVFMPILLACGGLAHLRVSAPREVP